MRILYIVTSRTNVSTITYFYCCILRPCTMYINFVNYIEAFLPIIYLLFLGIEME